MEQICEDMGLGAIDSINPSFSSDIPPYYTDHQKLVFEMAMNQVIHTLFVERITLKKGLPTERMIALKKHIHREIKSQYTRL